MNGDHGRERDADVLHRVPSRTAQSPKE